VTVNGVGKKAYQFVEKLWAIRRVGYLLDEIQLHGKSKEILDELVRLSRDYGIMTPYTSFLADERTELARGGELRSHAKRAADRLARDVAGAWGQVNAENRARLNTAWNLAGGRARDGGVAQLGNSSLEEYEYGRQEVVANVRNVGNQALYQRGRLWIAANASKLDPEKDRQKIKEIQRFSTDYFALVRANSVAENQILASQRPGEELLINLRGQAYRIR